MDDDTKRTPRGGAGRGPGKRPEGAPAKKAFSGPKAQGEKKPFRKREDGDRKPFAKADGDKRPFRKREEGDRKPFVRPDGEKRPFRPREDGPAGRKVDPGGEKTFRKRPDGESRPYVQSDGEKKPFRAREGADRKPYAKPDGERKPYRKREEEARPAFRPGKREREDGAAPAADDNVERIARRLARAGVASRRDAEAMIADGRVTLNGKKLDTPAINVSASDRIEIDGSPIPDVERTRLFLFHKPAGVVTTNRDPEGRRTVFDILPKGLPRLMTVGRLDINTEGLLLLTNDGGLSRVLELPATGWLRRYRVRVHGKVELQALEGLKDGIAVDGVFYGAIEATLDREQGSNAWLTIGLREGKNREVKNILGALGLDVTRLIRLSYGPFQLGELAEGEVRELKGKLLRDQLGDRLIEESGANFDAPIINEFSNKPVAANEQTRREDAPGERPNRKREREAKREDALGRLQTKPQRGGKPYGDKDKPKSFGDRDKPKSFGDKDKRFGGKPGKPGEREERAPEKQRSRSANVWMAPGARPMGEKKAAALAERTEGRRYAGKPRPAGKGGGSKPGSGPKGPRKPRGDR
ncbi:pseudouridine synthase [Mesorhizobium sp. CAU 1741]|uniref:pseudouridine synthase n=1 Tax=Mesorhizobium sp. CAU 1741 TaxID=3140366 RepID=UPI00325A8BC9